MSAKLSVRTVVFFLFGLVGLGLIFLKPFDAIFRVEEFAVEILEASDSSGLGDPFLLAGLVFAESRGLPGAVSKSGARGLCQLIPSTAAEVAEQRGIQGDLMNPQVNLLLGAFYLLDCLQKFDGDMDLGLLAYRIGPNAVRRGIRDAGTMEIWIEAMRKKKPSPWEYRTQILRLRDRFRERAENGIGWPEIPETEAWKTRGISTS
ncbi:MAG TPA: hypothetical protein DDW23_05090 [Planctomycetes bacterium]|nr:hypothetical protein [Planctomycetota bacterium]|tara:strand:- start:142 stop:756 length:615 start_codon:yes stop_codon:yes gene_type:complete